VLSQFHFEESIPVMPAQAGIQAHTAVAWGFTFWIPAFAGMTFPWLSIKTSLTDY
jgi:hypothetical protein